MNTREDFHPEKQEGEVYLGIIGAPSIEGEVQFPGIDPFRKLDFKTKRRGSIDPDQGKVPVFVQQKELDEKGITVQDVWAEVIALDLKKFGQY